MTQHHLFDQYADVLRDLSTHHPLILLLDDMQWADENTLELVQYVLRNVIHADKEIGDPGSGGRLMVIVAYREEDCPDDHRLSQALTTFESRGLCRPMRLAQLGSSEVTRFVGSMLGLDVDVEELAQWVERETGGNPFFIEEYMKTLVEEETLPERLKNLTVGFLHATVDRFSQPWWGWGALVTVWFYVFARLGGGALVAAVVKLIAREVGRVFHILLWPFVSAFNAAFAVALAEGKPEEEAGTFACGAAALSVTRSGAQPSMPTRDEVRCLLEAS